MFITDQKPPTSTRDKIPSFARGDTPFLDRSPRVNRYRARIFIGLRLVLLGKTEDDDDALADGAQMCTSWFENRVPATAIPSVPPMSWAKLATVVACGSSWGWSLNSACILSTEYHKRLICACIHERSLMMMISTPDGRMYDTGLAIYWST